MVQIHPPPPIFLDQRVAPEPLPLVHKSLHKKAKQGYLYLTGTYYYARVRIPGKSYKYFGCKELKKSLYASDLKTAKQSVRCYISEFERVVTLLRSNILTKEEKEQLVRQFFREALDRAEDRKIHSTRSTSKNEVEEVFKMSAGGSFIENECIKIRDSTLRIVLAYAPISVAFSLQI